MPLYEIVYKPNQIDFAKIFQKEHPVILDIGFGSGEVTLFNAETNPKINYLGIEVYESGIGRLLHELQTRRLTNVRVIKHDAEDVVNHMIPSCSLEGIHVFFPDPWPKKRHHKRRLLKLTFLQKALSKIISGGYIHIASDWSNYVEEINTNFKKLSDIVYTEDTKKQLLIKERPMTRFERKGLQQGRLIYELVFFKK